MTATDHQDLDEEASGGYSEPAEDDTWLALQELVLEMRRRVSRRLHNDRLHDALSASLDDLAAEAAALAEEGVLGDLPSAEAAG